MYEIEIVYIARKTCNVCKHVCWEYYELDAQNKLRVKISLLSVKGATSCFLPGNAWLAVVSK